VVRIGSGDDCFRLSLHRSGGDGFALSQGETYKAYCAAVPRLSPSLLPRVARAGLKPLWKQALVGESWVWVLAAAVVCYALILKIEAAYGTALPFALLLSRAPRS